MKRILLGSAGLCLFTAAVWATDAPNSATYISAEDVQKILASSKAADNTIRVIDMGQGYQMSVAVLHRISAANAPKPTPEQVAQQAAARAKLTPCGATSAPAGAKVGPSTTMRSIDSISDTYVITKGNGTLVTGGTMFDGTRTVGAGAGPACVGKVYGDFRVLNVKGGDIVVIPAGVPHGFSDNSDGLDFLSIRPDPQHVLPAGFVNPAL